ncbi:MAG: alpha/beta hydrolase fold domain-containing protein [Planctomycetota bacterium]|nr:alpha/beta hydrolase fold domain-containing protein [Planctomycetota bacterium]
MKNTLAFVASWLVCIPAVVAVFAEDAPTAQQLRDQLNKRGIKIARVEASLPKGVSQHLDLVYAEYGERKMHLDLFVPKAAKPVPAIMVIHGGGWLKRSKDKFHGLAHALAARGYATAAVEYRLGGEAKFPAAILDCNAATRWVRTNAKRFNIDPERIGAVGGSAGGHLVGLMATDSQVATIRSESEPEVSSRLRAAVILAGPLELATGPVAEKSRKQPADSNSNKWLGKTIDEAPELYKLASPFTHVSKTSAPMLFMTGQYDLPQRNIGTRDKLRALSIETGIHVYSLGRHGCWNQHPWFEPMVDDIDAFLTQVLKKSPAKTKTTEHEWGTIDWYADRLELNVMTADKPAVEVPRWNTPIGKAFVKSDPKREVNVKPLLTTWSLGLPKQTERPRPLTIVVPTLGRPYLPTLPRVVSSAASGSVTLAAHDAVTHGKLLRYEPQPHKNTVGYWANAEDWCEWTFYAERAGQFDLNILQGCGKGHGGSDVAVSVADQTVNFTVEDTGHFQNFKDRRIGRIELPTVGVYTLRIRAIKKAKVAVMDVRQIRLTPIVAK